MARVHSPDPGFELDSDSRPPVSNYVAGAADAAIPVSTHTTTDAAAAQESAVEYAAVAAPALIDEVTFLSGLNPDGTLAFYSYAAWNNDRPATYTGGYTLAYKWHADGSAPTAGTPGGTVTYAFNSASFWNPDEQAAFTAGLSLWSAVANISFSLTSDYGHAGIQFTRGSDDRAYADSDFAPHTQDTGRTDGIELFRLEQEKVSIDTSVPSFGPIGAFNGSNNIFSRSGGYPLHTILHEIGHAIGLGHGGPYNGTKIASQQYGAYDTRLYSLMSYFNNSNTNQYAPVQSTFWNSRYPVTPMIADILAIQRIYGAATSTPLTDVTFGYNTTISGPVANFFDFNTNTTPIVTLWATGSNNALDLSHTSDATINLNPGTFSSTHGLTNNIAIAYDTRIDRLVGSAGGTTVTGNNDGNYIDGAGGDDVIHGGSGDDTLLGGTGADRIYGGGGTNAITGGSEPDTAGYTLARSAYIITRHGDGSITVTGAGVTDTLREIEYLEFADQTIAVTSLGAEAILGGDAGTGEQQMPTLEEQVAYITGIDATGHIASQTSKTWDSPTNPPTYENTSNAGKWGANTLAGSSGGNINYDFDDASAWTAAERNVFNSVFALYAAIANVTFTEVASLGASDGITLLRTSSGAASADTALISSDSPAGVIGGTKLWTIPRSTISINTTEPSFNMDDSPLALFTRAGGHPWTTVLHEIGHALGLGHAGPYPATGITPENAQYSVYDSEVHTVMSYIHPSSTTPNSGSYPVTANWETVANGLSNWNREPVTLMPLDIMAIQRLYGAAASTPLSGGQTYGFNTNIGGLLQKFFDFTINTAPVITLWNAGGNNTLDLSGYSTASTVNLTAGSYSSVAGLTNNIAIAYNTAINTAIGGSGNDTITGNSADNILRGNAGTNTLNGGDGTDTARYAMTRSSYTITRNPNNTLTVTGTGISDTLSSIESLAFSDQTIAASSIGSVRSVTDFNGDGRSDLLWRSSSYAYSEWLMNGSTATSKVALGTVGANWKVEGAGDFTGDGKAEVLWRDSSGNISVENIAGSRFSGLGSPGALDNSWSVAAIGDFDGDGKSDILWRSSAYAYSQWLMNGSTATSKLALGSVGANWKVEGSGDFNGDGKVEVLWRDTHGNISVENIAGSRFSGLGSPGALDNSWSVAAIGDFNGDGKADILWHSGTSYSEWLMNGSTATSKVALGTVGANWKVQGSGDYNGDGKAEVLWRDSSGNISVENIIGSRFSGLGSPGALDSSWQLVSRTNVLAAAS